MTSTIGDTLIALIRTVVPVLVGALITYLAVPADIAALLEVLFLALFTALYYALVRLLSEKWPFFGWLLGYPTNPEYQPRHD